MKKEIIICIVVIGIVVMLNIITQGYTEKSMNELSTKLNDLKENIRRN